MINKLIIHNYKIFRDFELELTDDLNILVGDNEAGKSTILEAINLVLTKRLNGKFIENELTPYLFKNEVATEFVSQISQGENPVLPEIFLELYFDDVGSLASFRGSNNSLQEDRIGIRLEVVFDEDYRAEYEKLLEDRSQIKLIPIEYYKVSWRSFANRPLTNRSIPLGLSYIDATTIRLQSGTDYYLQNIINEDLDVKERVALAVEYRRLREQFSNQDSIQEINEKLDDRKGDITDKQLAIAIDISQKSSWETNIIPHLDSLPFHFSGKGEQNSLKIMLALDRRSADTQIVLIEEPENHLSFSTMNMLLKKIREKCDGKQIIVTTHSSFVLNKLGLDKLVLIHDERYVRLTRLPDDTQNYFQKLAGYDTLRLILAKKVILVEGPSDELIVQKAYFVKYQKLPIDDGIDVISVKGLSFKRYLDIARELDIETRVVTDNDGNYHTKVEQKYLDYHGVASIHIFADNDNSYPTLEPQIVKVNNIETLNQIFGTSFTTEQELIDYMTSNKTECALKLFETSVDFQIPQYVIDSVS